MEDIKDLKIEVPEGYEIDAENSTPERIILKKINNFDNLTYNDIVKDLYNKSLGYVVHASGCITYGSTANEDSFNYCNSSRHAAKLFAINKLLNTSIYLNKYWERKDVVWTLTIREGKPIPVWESSNDGCFVTFNSEKAAKKAIKILGEEEVLEALRVDY